MEQGMSTSDDYKNYVQLFNRGTMLKPRRYQLTAIHHQATVHKKTLVIMAVMQSFALRPRTDCQNRQLYGWSILESGHSDTVSDVHPHTRSGY
jgi:hypothetical protein